MLESSESVDVNIDIRTAFAEEIEWKPTYRIVIVVIVKMIFEMILLAEFDQE